MSALLRLAGIRWEEAKGAPSMEDLEAADGAVEALMEAADLYTTAGGVPSLAEWGDLCAAERAALVASRTRFLAGIVSSIALAVQSPAAALEVASVADGGAAKRTRALHEALSSAVSSLRGVAGGGGA